MNGAAAGQAPMMEVQTKNPAMVFVGGYLLPVGAFGINVSPVQMTVCDVTIVRDHPALPVPLRASLDKIKPEDTELAPELRAARAFSALPAVIGGQSLPVLVEMEIRNIKIVAMPKPKANGEARPA